MAYLLDKSATMTCPHVGGTVQLVNLAPRVLLGGNPAVTVSGAPLPVAGCPLSATPPGTTFCMQGAFVSGTTRVFAGGQALATSDSTAVFVNTGANGSAIRHQTRVEAK